jgi:hypothetical protein
MLAEALAMSNIVSIVAITYIGIVLPDSPIYISELFQRHYVAISLAASISSTPSLVYMYATLLHNKTHKTILTTFCVAAWVCAFSFLVLFRSPMESMSHKVALATCIAGLLVMLGLYIAYGAYNSAARIFYVAAIVSSVLLPFVSVYGTITTFTYTEYVTLATTHICMSACILASREPSHTI